MSKESKDYKNMPKKVFIKTFGCQMNEYDSEVMAGILQGEGYVLIELEEDADLVLLNTCSIRQHAEDKVLSKLGELTRLKENKPRMKIGLCGCMAERLKEELLAQSPCLDFILGPGNIKDLPGVLRRIENGGGKMVATGTERCPEAEGRALRQNDLSAYLPIVFGCNHFCSYCIVPHVRGRQKSREMDTILNEASGLAENNYKEITLLGQQVNAYGQGLDNGVNLALLLKKIDALKGLERVRFITAHPSKMDNGLIEAMAGLEKVCEHVHLPLQAGSDSVLRLMKRGYTRDEYMGIIEKLRKTIPEVSITTDIIVGFPGETEDDFDQTLSLIEQIRFDGAFMFKYSPRSGTRAATLSGQIEEEVKIDRLSRLIEIQNRITREKNNELVGRTEEVLVTSLNPRIPTEIMGRTRTNKVVFFEGGKDLIGKLITVEIIDSGTWHLKGRRKE